MMFATAEQLVRILQFQTQYWHHRVDSDPLLQQHVVKKLYLQNINLFIFQQIFPVIC